MSLLFLMISYRKRICMLEEIPVENFIGGYEEDRCSLFGFSPFKLCLFTCGLFQAKRNYLYNTKRNWTFLSACRHLWNTEWFRTCSSYEKKNGNYIFMMQGVKKKQLKPEGYVLYGQDLLWSSSKDVCCKKFLCASRIWRNQNNAEVEMA